MNRFRPRRPWTRPQPPPGLEFTSAHNRQRHVSSSSPALAELIQKTTSGRQIFISRSRDPHVNLSIEHYLLQKSPTHSAVLFLYINQPCVVIGRNQNPWIEANLRMLAAGRHGVRNADGSLFEGDVRLVRRRSGGGTVFHDGGNANYCVICPTADFHRDKHARMVAGALQRLGVAAAAVNGRHDIVLDESQTQGIVKPREETVSKALKVSGSAYKLTRGRALHHGTCLLSSPNLDVLPLVLRAPAKPWVQARGVESVRSPVGNAGVSLLPFQQAVVAAFGRLYGTTGLDAEGITQQAGLCESSAWVGGLVGEAEALEVPEIAQGAKELRSLEWTYLQTPQFTFRSHARDDEATATRHPRLPDSIPASARITLTVQHGTIQPQASHLSLSPDPAQASSEAQALAHALHRRRLHDITDWHVVFRDAAAFSEDGRGASRALADWLNALFGRGPPGK